MIKKTLLRWQPAGWATLIILCPAPMSTAGDERIPLQWLRPVGATDVAVPAASGDPAIARAEGMADNEAARFIRRLIARSYQVVPESADDPAVLAVVLIPGGNKARLGLNVQGGAAQPTRAYIELGPSEKALSTLFLHEGGHVVHFRMLGGRPPEPSWNRLPHTLFAVTTRTTALTEGYGIHFEALNAHFGSADRTRAFYDRQAPQFGAGLPVDAAFYFPLSDQWTYSQTWSRYQAVRDGLAAFQGFGDLAHQQLDASRDRARLRTPGQLLASEGTAAASMFWLSARRAEMLGARPGGGLDQPGVMAAEEELMRALRRAGQESGPKATMRELVEAYAALYPDQAPLARSIWLDLTHGGTADAHMAQAWKRLYDAALVMNISGLSAAFDPLQAIRQTALQSPEALWKAVAPELPVEVKGATLTVFGAPVPLRFDLNAAGGAELKAVPSLTVSDRAKILTEQAHAPFTGLDDFKRRVGPAAAKPFVPVPADDL